MTKHPDENADLVTRATLLARLEIVSEELENAAERLATLVEEIKARAAAKGEPRADDRTGTDQQRPESDQRDAGPA